MARLIKQATEEAPDDVVFSRKEGDCWVPVAVQRLKKGDRIRIIASGKEMEEATVSQDVKIDLYLEDATRLKGS